MESTAQITRFTPHSLNQHSFSSKPISSIPLISSSKVKFILKTSFNSLSTNPQNHHSITKKPSFETQIPFSSFIKTTCIAIFTASLFFSSFSKHSIAAPVSQPPTVEAEEEEEEKLSEQHLNSNPEDIDALRTSMEFKLEVEKFLAVTSILRMTQIEPSEKLWRLMKAYLSSYNGDIELAKSRFEEILSDDPLFVEAYHGLAMTIWGSKSEEFETLLKRIENGMEQCKVEKRKEDLIDFRMLVAHVRFLQGNYVEALKVYQVLVKEEPMDFRPYFYQAIIYTLLKRTSDAKKPFDKFQQLVPEDHPYACYVEGSVMATDDFTQMIRSHIPSSKN